MIWLVVLVVLYLALLAIAAYVSFYPVRSPVFFSPGSLGVPQEDIQFGSAEGPTLRGWWIGPREGDTVAVLAHGYLMNRSELAPVAAWLADWGIPSVMFDLRAHGKSGGRKCGFGFAEADDVREAVRFARERCPGARVVLFGSSMGAAACVEACARQPGLADALVLDSCYGRMPSAVLGWWRFLGGRTLAFALAPTVLLAWPFAGFNPFRFDIAGRLRSIGPMPVLVFHGEADNLALPKEAMRNIQACVGPTSSTWLPDSGHSEGRWLHPDLYKSALRDFLTENGFMTKVLANERA